MRRNQCFSALAGIVGAVLLFSSGTAASGTWQGQEVRSDGKIKVLNPDTPADAPVTLALNKQWTAEGDSDDYLFGVLTDVATDNEGNIYLLDAQLNEIMVFSPDGEYLQSIGREGEGPGEFRRPSGLFMTPEGNVAVLQRMPGKIILLTRDGEPAGNHPLPETDGMRMLNDGVLSGDGIVVGLMQFARTDAGMESRSSLVRLNSKGEQVAEYVSRKDARDFSSMEMDEKTFGRAVLVWAAASDGRVFTSSDFDAYRIEVWNPDGTLDRIIERKYEPRVRSAKEIEDNTPRIMIRGRGGRGGEVKVNMSKTSRAIERMYAREDGTLWVLSSHGGYDCGENNIATFDVFDRSGKFMQQITLQGEGAFADDGIHLVKDRVLIVKGLQAAARAMMGGDDEDSSEEEDVEPMSVVCYNMNMVAKK